MKRILVLGGGLVGGVMARDIALEPGVEVTVADRDEAVLARVAARGRVKTVRCDFSDGARIAELARGHDLVLGAAPGFLGFSVMRAVLEAGRPMVDISFMPENALELDNLAKGRGVPAVFDCGVAPGMSNLLVGRAASLLDEVDSATILVGGLPVQRYWPFEYTAVFSPIDVIEEYTRPARLVENGAVVEREALSDVELVDFEGVGTLEAFNTDGLRSLLFTVKARNMKEKTMRWPGHVEKMRLLREIGFFGKEPIEVAGVKVRPIDLTAWLMFPLWKLREGDEEITIMRVQVEGRKGNVRQRHIWDLLDSTDKESGEMSMARTTGFPATAVARLVLQGTISKPGVHAPEMLGREPEVYEAVMEALRARRVIFRERVEEIAQKGAA